MEFHSSQPKFIINFIIVSVYLSSQVVTVSDQLQKTKMISHYFLIRYSPHSLFDRYIINQPSLNSFLQNYITKIPKNIVI